MKKSLVLVKHGEKSSPVLALEEDNSAFHFFLDSAGWVVFNIQKAFHKDQAHRRADGSRGEQEGGSGKQMGSTVWGLPGICCLAVGRSERT